MAGIWLLIIRSTLTRLEDQGSHFGPRLVLRVDFIRFCMSFGHTIVTLQQVEALQFILPIHVGYFGPE